MICYFCKREINADFNMARRWTAGVSDLVPVHKACIDHHDRKLNREFFINTLRDQRDGKATFSEWYDGGDHGQD